MHLRDNGLRFSPITIGLHWLIAALLFSILGLGGPLPKAPVRRGWCRCKICWGRCCS